MWTLFPYTTLFRSYGQGFAIGRPVPIGDVLEQLPLYAAVAEGPVESITLGEAAPVAIAM
jgi:hypothetical protein